MPVFDAEFDGLNPTKIHCLCASDGFESTEPNQIKEWLVTQKHLIGHNIQMYDLPHLKRLLGIEILQAKVYDTLGLSWAVFPNRSTHGLEDWGTDAGVPKPEITDWENLTPEEYLHRCREDVKINKYLWDKIIRYLLILYDGDKKEIDRYCQYISYKLDCTSYAYHNGVGFDYHHCKDTLELLEGLKAKKEEELRSVMPIIQKYKTKKRPKVFHKKDGTLSSRALDWIELLKQKKLPESTTEVKVPDKIEQPNPDSPSQVKDWLLSLGWKPCTYNYVKEDNGTDRRIPQVRNPLTRELTPSVLALAEKVPEVEVLAGLSVLQHRASILKGFLENAQRLDSGEYILRADISGFTNTLRLRHRAPLVNLPGCDKPYGTEVRACLVPLSGYTICGADLTSLEDTTKRHYIYPYDPDYVNEMSRPGYDPHLDLARFAGVVTQSDIDRYNSTGDPKIKKVRTQYKTTNYSATYGIGKVKLARELGITEDEAEKLLQGYWSRNWAIKAFADSLETKTIQGQKWVYNPVSGFWYSLRFDKDKFSTVNQSTGAYIFDLWVAHYRREAPSIVLQFHDESGNMVKLGKEAQHEQILRKAIDKVNKKLKLNVPLDIDVKFGKNYAEVH